MLSRSLVFLLLVWLITTDTSLFAQTNVLIVYHSKTGNTRLLAEAVAEGARTVKNANVVLKSVEEAANDDLLKADAIIVGSPVYNANVTAEIQAFISGWPFEGMPLKGKIGAAFVTAGGISAGEEITQMNILQSMLIFGMIVMGGPDWQSPFGASAIVGEQPYDNYNGIAPQFLEKGRGLGKRVAETAMRLKN